jgi:hypothetical protein
VPLERTLVRYEFVSIHKFMGISSVSSDSDVSSTLERQIEMPSSLERAAVRKYIKYKRCSVFDTSM